MLIDLGDRNAFNAALGTSIRDGWGCDLELVFDDHQVGQEPFLFQPLTDLFLSDSLPELDLDPDK